MSSKSKKLNGLTSTFLLIVALIFIAFITVSLHGDISTPLDIRAVPLETFKQFPKSPIMSDVLSSSSSRIQSSYNNNKTRNTTRSNSNSKNNNKQKSFELHFIHIPKCGGM